MGYGCESKLTPLISGRGAESSPGSARAALVTVLSLPKSQADGLIGGELFSRLDFWLVLCVGEFEARI